MLDNGDLAKEIFKHLQGVGEYVQARDVVEFLDQDHIKAQYNLLKKTISVTTAKRWMSTMGYRWGKARKGQYIDGHERKDMIEYRNDIFLPTMSSFESRLRNYHNGKEEPASALSSGRRVVIWYHDESTFYANDRRRIQWIHSRRSPKPLPKGEGASLMVADFVSADYGWLHSPDGSESARVLFKAGRNRNGYFTNAEILEHATKAMDILTQHYPNEDHVFVFDNAPTHLKRADTALSALKMSVAPTSQQHQMWGVDVNVIGADGKPEYGTNGKLKKQRVRMGDACFNGQAQSLYFTPDDGTGRQHVFKGMARILAERNIDTTGLKRECEGFKCMDTTANCCIRRILWNQPDFVGVKSILEEHCKARGFCVLFLPKFHCELNFIEQCWGMAKRIYRLKPRSTAEADLERNTLDALDSVHLTSMRRFSTRSRRFMDAYRKGLSGKQAAWATKKYHGHRCVPESILAEYNEAQNHSKQ